MNSHCSIRWIAICVRFYPFYYWSLPKKKNNNWPSANDPFDVLTIAKFSSTRTHGKHCTIALCVSTSKLFVRQRQFMWTIATQPSTIFKMHQQSKIKKKPILMYCFFLLLSFKLSLFRFFYCAKKVKGNIEPQARIVIKVYRCVYGWVSQTLLLIYIYYEYIRSTVQFHAIHSVRSRVCRPLNLIPAHTVDYDMLFCFTSPTCFIINSYARQMSICNLCSHIYYNLASPARLIYFYMKIITGKMNFVIFFLVSRTGILHLFAKNAIA